MAAQYTDPDLGKSPEQLYAERSQRVRAALELKRPDRIPIQLPAGYLLAEMGGVTRQELQDDLNKQQELLEQTALYFQPDTIMGLYNNPRASVILGDRMTRWPGYGLPPDGSFQFVEGEYMKGEDYDAFLEDPGDWAIRKYWPRVFKNLEGLALLPPLGIAAYGAYALPNLGILTAPPLMAALQTIAKAAAAQAEVDACLVQSGQRMAALGFAQATFVGSITEAPFDFMSDTLRGMRGVMLDIHRRPDQLLAAQEKVLKFQLEYAINWSRATGINVSFIPLHRGSDGFMSLPQFEKFYWPQLKALQVGLVEAGIMPFVFYEGVWDKRLDYLNELPKGKTAGLFQLSDIFKVKQVVGKTMCIVGGMPNSLLAAGTVEDVRTLTRKLCEVVGDAGGYIMSNGIGELEGSRPELVKAWVEATKEFGVYH